MTTPDVNPQLSLERVAPLQRRILVLESDRLIKSLIKEWLQMAGCETLCALNTAGASALWGTCNVVLVDVPAPFKAARDTVKRLSRAVPGVPVIAMSADIPPHGKSASDALARELGAAAVLVKPFSREALLYAIHRAVA